MNRLVGTGGSRLLTVYALLFVAFLYLPILLIPLFSFNNSPVVTLPLQGFTTRWYESLWAIDALHQAALNSLKVGIATAVIATVLALVGARALARYRFRGKPFITGVVMLPLVMPDMIVALALLVVLLKIGLELSLFTVTLGHVLIALPFAMAVLSSSFEGFDVTLEEASADLGETPLWTFWRVTLPIVLPGIMASLLVAFTVSLDEFILAFFLSGTDSTLPVYIWGQMRFPSRVPAILALGTLLLAFSFLLLIAAEALRRWSARRMAVSDAP